MNVPTPPSAEPLPPTPAAPVGAPGVHATPASAPRTADRSWLVWPTVGVAAVALVVCVMLWQRLDRIQQELARQATDVGLQSTETRDLAAKAESLTQELQARLTVAEVRLSEVSLQRTQLEELMLSVSRSRDDTLVLDIESSIRLAMQQAELTGSGQPLVSALHAADKRIARAAQPRLNPVQRAMARDVQRLQAAASTDLPALAQRLDEVTRLVDELPLLNAALLRPGSTAARSAALATAPNADADGDKSVAQATTAAGVGSATGAGSTTETSAPQDGRDAPAPKPTRPQGRSKTKADQAADDLVGLPDDSAWGGVAWVGGIGDGLHRLWQKTLLQSGQSLRDLVRVSRIEEPEAVLLAPDQSVFLRENLKLRLLNARLSLLSRQVTAARADLVVARAALGRYFDAQSPSTRRAVQSLGDVLQGTRNVELPRPDETLTALAAAAGGR